MYNSFDISGMDEMFFDDGEDGYIDDYDGMDFSDEDDEFLGKAWGWLTRKGSTQRRLALNAAKGTLGGALPTAGAVIGTPFGPWGTIGGAALGGTAAGLISSALPDQMDYFAALAAEAEDEAEAEAFIGALVPMAARLNPRVGSAIMKVAPQLIRGTAGTVRALHHHPAGRRLLRNMGVIVRRTGADVIRRAVAGRPLSGGAAVKQLAKNTYYIMQRPKPGRRPVNSRFDY